MKIENKRIWLGFICLSFINAEYSVEHPFVSSSFVVIILFEIACLWEELFSFLAYWNLLLTTDIQRAVV